jgi:hypothetical protein
MEAGNVAGSSAYSATRVESVAVAQFGQHSAYYGYDGTENHDSIGPDHGVLGASPRDEHEKIHAKQGAAINALQAAVAEMHKKVQTVVVTSA